MPLAKNVFFLYCNIKIKFCQVMGKIVIVKSCLSWEKFCIWWVPRAKTECSGHFRENPGAYEAARVGQKFAYGVYDAGNGHWTVVHSPTP